MELLHRIILLAVCVLLFRWIFAKNRYYDILWEEIGKRVNRRLYFGVWLILTIVISVLLQSVLALLSLDAIASDAISIILFGFCFSFFPTMEIKTIGYRSKR